jgi:hypothetical protein
MGKGLKLKLFSIWTNAGGLVEFIWENLFWGKLTEDSGC